MENLYITFEVTINESAYQYDHRGKGECTMQMPRAILKQVSFDGIFTDLLGVALADYDTKNETKEERGMK